MYSNQYKSLDVSDRNEKSWSGDAAVKTGEKVCKSAFDRGLLDQKKKKNNSIVLHTWLMTQREI
jgi:hypothetical protein